jgi:hypothetical protein
MCRCGCIDVHITTRATTSNSNLEKKLHQRNYIPMIVKVYREMGKNKRSRGRRGLTLIKIIIRHHKNYTSSKKGKRWQE